MVPANTLSRHKFKKSVMLSVFNLVLPFFGLIFLGFFVAVSITSLWKRWDG